MAKYIDAEKLKRFVESIGLTSQKSADYNDGRDDVKMVVLDFIDSLQQEQPELDLEREIDRAWEYLEKDYSPSALDKSVIIVSGLVGQKQFSKVAKYFFDLGLNARKV